MKRIILISLGWLCVGLGFVGVFVPGIPTTIFLIIALWAFTKSSEKLRHWLLNHKRFGPILNNWQEHKVVPRRAKILMVVLMSLAVILFYYSLQSLILTIGLIIILVSVAIYVISLPSKIPENSY
ncbi:uncharacterized protein METZ01_LOCUS168559 [marine metagenome]|mgnify:FL=1|uniref:Inner membrane protein YbaN n=1 Tax=marine metagenome TaxID=408172 RepID=A0A382BPK8_9ZZZZ|tara:strand:+ start:330 stop:704 length:375 start_codon:yes stop_codon:yes gene_type:complete